MKWSRIATVKGLKSGQSELQGQHAERKLSIPYCSAFDLAAFFLFPANPVSLQICNGKQNVCKSVKYLDKFAYSRMKGSSFARAVFNVFLFFFVDVK